MKRLLVFAVLLIVLVACGAPAPAAVPARVVAGALQTETPVWRVVGRIGDWDVNLTIYQQPGVVATPSPTAPPATSATPTSATPTPPLTNTARPSVTPTLTITLTPSPTFTSTPTFTPDASPTPPATSTPGSATLAPDGKLCELVVGIPSGINIRAAASTTSTIKSKAPQGTRQVVDQFVTAGGYLWAYLPMRAGYMVVGQYINPFAWWVSFNSNEFCDTLPGWDFAIPPPPEVAQVVKAPIFAFHAVPGANVNEMIEAGRVLLAADIPFRR